MNVTVTCVGLPVAPTDVTVTWPVCVPVARPAGLSVRVIEPLPVPPVGTTLSHVVSLAAFHTNVPPVGFETFRVLVFEPVPCWALS